MSETCPGRVTTVGEIVVNCLMQGFATATAAVALAFYMSRKSQYPIRQRLPTLSAIFTVAFIVTSTIVTLASLFGEHFSCSLTWYFGAIAQHLGLVAIVYRGFLIVIEYEAADAIASQSRESAMSCSSSISKSRPYALSERPLPGEKHERPSRISTSEQRSVHLSEHKSAALGDAVTGSVSDRRGTSMAAAVASAESRVGGHSVSEKCGHSVSEKRGLDRSTSFSDRRGVNVSTRKGTGAGLSDRGEQRRSRPEKIVERRNWILSKTRMTIALVVLNILLWIPIPIIFWDLPFSDSIRTESCTAFSQTGLQYEVSIGAVTAFLSLLLAYRIRKIHENFHIREEFRGIGYLAIYVVVSFGVQIFTPPIRDASMCRFRFINITSFHIPDLVLIYLVLLKPLSKVRKNKVKRTSFRSVVSPSAKAMTLKMDQLQIVLHSPERRQFLVDFLVKEFASERMYFWIEIERLMTMEIIDQKELVAQAENIFSRFCQSKAKSTHSVDLSAHCREVLEQFMTQMRNGNLTDDQIRNGFAQARKEVELLIFELNFKRFCDSEEFSKMCESVQSPRGAFFDPNKSRSFGRDTALMLKKLPESKVTLPLPV